MQAYSFPLSILLDFQSACLVKHDTSARIAEFRFDFNSPIFLNPHIRYEAEVRTIYFPFSRGYVESGVVISGYGSVLGIVGAEVSGVRLPLRPGLGPSQSLALSLHWWSGSSKAPSARITATKLLLIIHESPPSQLGRQDHPS